MSSDTKIKFEKWILQNEIPDNIKNYLVNAGYDSVDMLPFLSIQVINKSNLSKKYQNLLKAVLKLKIDSETINQNEEIVEKDQLNEGQNEEIVKREQSRWKEFGLAKKFKSWEKDYLPVELFSPDGHWAWNTGLQSLTFRSKVMQIWTKFDENKPGWIMSPPVLLPSELGAFKYTFNIKLSPEREGELPELQMVLMNDGYNKHISQFNEFPLRLRIEFRFICCIKGSQIGNTIEKTYEFKELFDSENFDIPGNVLQLKKPPIISIKVSKI